MADEATDTTAGESTEDKSQDTSTSTTNTYTQEQLNAVLADHKKRIQAQFADYDDIKAQLATAQEASEAKVAEVATIASERDSLKSDLTAKEMEALKLRVAMEKSVPAELIDRLKGSTAEELQADADVLLKAVRPSGGSGFDGGVPDRVTATDFANENDPKKVLEFLSKVSS